jgi:hypothetical protein
MILLQGRGAIYGELWFDEEPPRGAAVDVFVYRQREVPVAHARATPGLSLLTDLSVAEDAILERFGKDCRYKIRRAESKDGLRLEFIAEPAGRLQEFCEFFDAFARQKSHAPCDREWLAAACAARQLALAAVMRDGEALVWHAYLLSGRTAWLQYTGSRYRDRDNDYRALVGRANRWLHWQAMLRFRELGLQRYDWGGMFEDESVAERAGINNFKRDFGGALVHSYECIVPATLRGRLYLPLRDAWRRWKPSGQHVERVDCDVSAA